MDIQKIRALLQHVTIEFFGQKLLITTDYDKRYGRGTRRRVYLQVMYNAPCSKTGKIRLWKGRKWVLSAYMTEDEVIKTAFLAMEIAVRHEMLEGFRYDGMPIFNPHTPFRALLSVSSIEDQRVEGVANFDV